MNAYKVIMVNSKNVAWSLVMPGETVAEVSALVAELMPAQQLHSVTPLAKAGA